MTTSPAAPHAHPQPPDPSPEEVLRDLNRPVPEAPGGGVFGTLLAAVPTFGLFPALLWPSLWKSFAAAERRQYEAVAQWLRRHTRHPGAAAVAGRAAALRPVRLLSALPVACCAAAAAFFVSVFWSGAGDPFWFDNLLKGTYHHAPAAHYAGPNSPTGAGVTSWGVLFWTWTTLLSVAYFCHWLQVQLHARRVRRFLDAFNEVVIDDALGPVFLPPVGFGLRPLWVLAAIGLIYFSAPWGVALMMAGAVQRTYTRSAGRCMRSALATRFRDMTLLYRPPAGLWGPPPPLPPVEAPPACAAPSPLPGASPRQRCETPGCRMPLPAGARFCPRCGVRAVAPLDRVA